MATKSFLYTRWVGPEGGPIWIAFGGFLDALTDIEAFATARLPTARVLCVQGPRNQTQGGDGETLGQFWYIGAQDRPELTTFGDGLFQAETLLAEVSAEAGTPVGLIGRNQGASIALVLATIWPERVRDLCASEHGLPRNFDRMPLDLQPMGQIEYMLEALDQTAEEFTTARLTALGARKREQTVNLHI